MRLRSKVEGIAVFVLCAQPWACDAATSPHTDASVQASVTPARTSGPVPAPTDEAKLESATRPARAAEGTTPTLPLAGPAPDGKAPRPPWTDADHDCQRTRTEVLLAENLDEDALEFADNRGCVVNAGRWRCPYTGELLTRASELDIDHMVPLKNAWISGAHAWPEQEWVRFANDLSQAQHLIAVAARANRSKGARGPEAWLPPRAEYRCTYVRDWVEIKQRWQLGTSEAEAAAIAAALRSCEAGEAPPLPQARERRAAPAPSPAPPPQECCKTCRAGKACGDACISRDRHCEQPPGCACDG